MITTTTDMVADIFTADILLGQLLIEVPSDIDQASLVGQVLDLARVGGLLRCIEEPMVFVKMRPADPDDDLHLYEGSVTETMH